MTQDQAIDPRIIIDLGDRIIEEAQGLLIQNDDLNADIYLDLLAYSRQGIDFTKLRQALLDYLQGQEIRLYEDTCDEEGTITSSREFYAKIFENLVLDLDKMTLRLTYSMHMKNLLA